jgi:hypothetical protein
VRSGFAQQVSQCCHGLANRAINAQVRVEAHIRQRIHLDAHLTLTKRLESSFQSMFGWQLYHSQENEIQTAKCK